MWKNRIINIIRKMRAKSYVDNIIIIIIIAPNVSVLIKYIYLYVQYYVVTILLRLGRRRMRKRNIVLFISRCCLGCCLVMYCYLSAVNIAIYDDTILGEGLPTVLGDVIYTFSWPKIITTTNDATRLVVGGFRACSYNHRGKKPASFRA